MPAENSDKEPRVFKYSPSDKMTPANMLTLVRLALSFPFLVWMYSQESGWLLWSAFALLALSDVIDGIWARRAGPTTSGAFLDPLADKILAMGGFIVLGLNGYYIWLPIIIMAAREISVSIARSVLARYKISLPARKLGKAKTLVQLLAVGFPIWPPLAEYNGFNEAFLWFAAALSVISGIDLFVNAKREVQEKQTELEAN